MRKPERRDADGQQADEGDGTLHGILLGWSSGATMPAAAQQSVWFLGVLAGRLLH
jgi:hypothetical protein